MTEKQPPLELTSLYTQLNGDPETAAVPKDISGRKQSSSRKFKIETVAAQDDPLYNLNAPSVPSRRPSRMSLTDVNVSDLSLSAFTGSTRVAPEGVDGESVFQSIEDLRKRRTSSNISGGDQKFYSVEDLDKAVLESELCNGASVSQIEKSEQSEVDSPTSVHADGHAEKVSKPGPITCRRAGNRELKIDDSFYKRVTVEIKVDGDNMPDPDAVTNIFMPVPSPVAERAPSPLTLPTTHEDYHETITSAYETNISINKLLRERHKGSLAAVGRLFGSKQKELEKERSDAELITAAVVNKSKRKKCYQYIRPIHISLVFTFLIIVTATALTLVIMESALEKQFSSEGYHLDYRTRELVIYKVDEDTESMSLESIKLFKGYLGVNIPPGYPRNCTISESYVPQPGEIGCYNWNNASTVKLFSNDSITDEHFCLTVKWETELFEPVLEDCIDISNAYGHWYGGHIKRQKLSLDNERVNFTTYMPGEYLGSMAERFWFSTKGIAVVATHDFPLHLRMDTKNKRLCLSSWYGYHAGDKKLSYAICRSSDHRKVHKHVMNQFYEAYADKELNSSNILNKPIYSVSSDAERNLVDQANVSYSYILNIGSKHSILGNPPYANLPINSGVQLSPYLPFSALFNIFEVWITSTDMDVARLFNVDGKPQLLLDPSISNLTTFVDMLPSNDSDLLVFVTDLAVGDIHGQEYYLPDYSIQTFQPYIQNILSLLSSSNQGPVMTSSVCSSQKLSVITYLPPSDDISERIRQVLHSSLMGYDLINPGVIPATLSDEHLIRMLQFYIFMPVIQFSHALVDQMSRTQVAEAWKKCLKTRKYLGVNETISEHLETDDKQYPLYAPVWWNHVDIIESTSDIVDQFIFADRYLVAPVVNSSATTRNVFLPPGVWLRMSLQWHVQSYVDYGSLHHGNKTIEFDVDLDQVLIFDHGQY